jgi:alanine dehydrogenase
VEFGVPKEVRDLEMRVGLTPAGVLALVQDGHAFLHLPVVPPDLIEARIRQEITAIAYETIVDGDGLCPVRLPISETARRFKNQAVSVDQSFQPE